MLIGKSDKCSVSGIVTQKLPSPCHRNLSGRTGTIFIFYVIVIHVATCSCRSTEDIWEKVPCNVDFQPDNCDFSQIPSLTVDDFERCAPAMLNISSRNYFLGAAGRRITYNENKKAYRRIKIVPKVLRDVSRSSLNITTLGQKLYFPIGLSPAAYQTNAHPLGEIATVRGMSNMGTVMILSSYATTTIEDVAIAARGGSSHLWMQTDFFRNRSITMDLVSRAERAGFEAIVVTVDSPIPGTLTCNGRSEVDSEDRELVNIPGLRNAMVLIDTSETFKGIAWLSSITRLPIVVKGILSASDARLALRAGASAIFVSNHGGRQLDSAPATIDVLPGIVDAVNDIRPRRDVYVDSGIRNGWDVYKAIASGAKMVFVGRPVIWGLAKGGQKGVETILNILRREFEEAMRLSGASNPSKITRDTLRTSGGKM